MSRIRSVHPGFFKDERIVPCSAFARLLFIGLGTEADDKGIFEWKPLTIKMQIFPGDNVDVLALLDELIKADAVMQFDAGEKTYGAIRNFRKYQKPKTPNDIYPMPDYVAEYVAFPQKGETPPVETEQFPPNGEKSLLMEDGGGRVEEEDRTSPPVIVAEARALFDEVWEAFPQNPTSSESKARAAFEALKGKEKTRVLDGAKRYRRWFVEDCKARERTEDAGLKFVPHLATWIISGAYREADSLPIKGESSQPVVPMTKLDRFKDEALFVECERIGREGKRAPMDQWAFRDEIVDQARKNLAPAAA